jgi:hypothetical protein
VRELKQQLQQILLVYLILAALLAIAWWLLPAFLDMDVRHARASLENGAEVGWPRQKVIEHLGKPGRVVKTKDEYDYLRNDRSYAPAPAFEMQKEILVYTDVIWRMYVFIGNDGRVTHVHMART